LLGRAFDEYAVADLLGIPDKTRPIAIIPVGYPDENPPRSKDGTGKGRSPGNVVIIDFLDSS